MSTSPINNNTQSPNQMKGANYALKTEDFIKMMITQLQNQDPMEPAKNQELLAQMSQIGQLQSSTMLQESLQGMMLQNQLGNSGGLIGRQIEGMDDNNETVNGIVNSVRVEDETVYLELDTGHKLKLSRVTTIAPAESESAV